MLRFGERKIAKEKFYAWRKPITIWDVNVNNIVISKLARTKPNSKYLVGYLDDKYIRPLVLIMPKMSGYVRTFKVEDKINKLMSFHINNEKLLERYEAIWTNTEYSKNIEFNVLPVYNGRYIKT